MCVPLDDQENIIYTMPPHATMTGSYMRWQDMHRAPVVAMAKGTLCGSTLQPHRTCFSLENKRDMTIGRWRAPLYSKHAAQLVQKSHCTVLYHTMVVL